MTTTTTCLRCGATVTFTAAIARSEARLLRHSSVPEGFCANCALTAWLRSTSPLDMLIEQQGTKTLLNEAVQQQIGAVLRAGESDATMPEFDWGWIIAHWSLPLKAKARR